MVNFIKIIYYILHSIIWVAWVAAYYSYSLVKFMLVMHNVVTIIEWALLVQEAVELIKPNINYTDICSGIIKQVGANV